MQRGRREALILGAAGIVATAAGFLAGPLLLRSTKVEGVNADLHSATFVDLAGTQRRLKEWQGRILVCNFWATWCAPCREEIPLLMAVRAKFAPKGVEIVGIAIDNLAKVSEFTASLKISYPILIAEANGLDLIRKLGNNAGGLPYTVVADRQGSVLHRKLGALHLGDLDAILAPLLQT
jgi:thiol-disulfide isomerase/thioredoxin